MTLDLVRVLSQTPERFDDKVHAMPAPEPEAAESMQAPVSDDDEVYDRDQDAGETETASADTGSSQEDVSAAHATDSAASEDREVVRHVEPEPPAQIRPMRRRMAAE